MHSIPHPDSKFSCTSIDMTLEQSINRDAKTRGGTLLLNFQPLIPGVTRGHTHSANQWTDFYMIGTSVMKELNDSFKIISDKKINHRLADSILYVALEYVSYEIGTTVFKTKSSANKTCVMEPRINSPFFRTR